MIADSHVPPQGQANGQQSPQFPLLPGEPPFNITENRGPLSTSKSLEVPPPDVPPRWNFLGLNRLSQSSIPTFRESPSSSIGTGRTPPWLLSNEMGSTNSSALMGGIESSRFDARKWLIELLFSHSELPNQSESQTQSSYTSLFDQNRIHLKGALDDFIRLFLLHSAYVKSLAAFDKFRIKSHSANNSSLRVPISSNDSKIESTDPLIRDQSEFSSLEHTIDLDDVATDLKSKSLPNSDSNSSEWKRESSGSSMLTVNSLVSLILNDIRNQINIGEETLQEKSLLSHETNITMEEDRHRIRKLAVANIQRLSEIIDEKEKIKPEGQMGVRKFWKDDLENKMKAIYPKKKKESKQRIKQTDSKSRNNCNQRKWRGVSMVQSIPAAIDQVGLSSLTWWNDQRQFYRRHKRTTSHIVGCRQNSRSQKPLSSLLEPNSATEYLTTYAPVESDQQYFLWTPQHLELEKESPIHSDTSLECLSIESINQQQRSYLAEFREASMSSKSKLPHLSMSGLALLWPIIVNNETYIAPLSQSSTPLVEKQNQSAELKNRSIRDRTARSNSHPQTRSVLAKLFDYCLLNVDNERDQLVMSHEIGTDSVSDLALSLEQSLGRAQLFRQSFAHDLQQLSNRSPFLSSSVLQALHHSGELRQGKTLFKSQFL